MFIGSKHRSESIESWYYLCGKMSIGGVDGFSTMPKNRRLAEPQVINK